MHKVLEKAVCDMVATEVQKLIMKIALGEETADPATLAKLQAIVDQAEKASKRSKRRWW